MDDSNHFTLFKNFLGTLPEILWPVVFIAALFLLTRVVPAISRKLKERGSSKSIEGFHAEVRLLDETLMLAREEWGHTDETDKGDLRVLIGDNQAVRDVLETARLDPEIGIIKLIGLLDRETRLLAGSFGGLEHSRILKDQGPLKFLMEKRYLPRQIAKSCEVFTGLGNSVVRRRIPKDHPDVPRVLEMGLLLLETMRSMHEAIHRVLEVDIDLFTNEECNHVIPGVKGVLIEKLGPQHRRIETRILPTTNEGYYEKGARVTWRWNVENLWSAAYYIDPHTNEKRRAWESSAEFCGERVDEP
jgi:hypothetical protein